MRSSTRATSARIGEAEVAVGTLLRIEPREGSRIDHYLAQAVVFLLGAVAPMDGLRLTEFGNLRDPVQESAIPRRRRFLRIVRGRLITLIPMFHDCGARLHSY